jgi:hypothetical protein
MSAKIAKTDDKRIERLQRFCSEPDRASLNDLNIWDLRMIDEFIDQEIADAVAKAKSARVGW